MPIVATSGAPQCVLGYSTSIQVLLPTLYYLGFISLVQSPAMYAKTNKGALDRHIGLGILQKSASGSYFSLPAINEWNELSIEEKFEMCSLYRRSLELSEPSEPTTDESDPRHSTSTRNISPGTLSPFPGTPQSEARDVLVKKENWLYSAQGGYVHRDPDFRDVPDSAKIYPNGWVFPRPKMGWTGREELDFMQSCIDHFFYNCPDGSVLLGRDLFEKGPKPGVLWWKQRFNRKAVEVHAWLKKPVGMELLDESKLPYGAARAVEQPEKCFGGPDPSDLDNRLMAADREVRELAAKEACDSFQRFLNYDVGKRQYSPASPSSSHSSDHFEISPSRSPTDMRPSYEYPRGRPLSDPFVISPTNSEKDLMEKELIEREYLISPEKKKPRRETTEPRPSEENRLGTRRSNKPRPIMPPLSHDTTFMDLEPTCSPKTKPDPDQTVHMQREHNWETPTPTPPTSPKERIKKFVRHLSSSRSPTLSRTSTLPKTPTSSTFCETASRPKTPTSARTHTIPKTPTSSSFFDGASGVSSPKGQDKGKATEEGDWEVSDAVRRLRPSAPIHEGNSLG